MTKYSTGNTVGSSDPRDLYDNAQNLDEFANSTTKETHPDRLGVPRKTLHGMQTEFNQLSNQAEDARDNARLAETGAQTAQGLAEGARADALEYRNDAESFRDASLANSNYKGAWSDLSGSLDIPASVYHNGRYWLLISSLTDVTASEPGTKSDWYHVYMGSPLPLGPGPQTLIAGDMTDGFFGEVSAGELFSGDGLALELGVTEGVPQKSESGWLKFACDNKILFVAKQAFRHSISWDHLYARGIVYGTDDNGASPRNTPTNQLTKVSALGYDFKVRLLTGGNADPVDVSDSRFYTDDMAQLDLGGGSEWNRLMYRIHQDVPTDDGTDGMRQDRHGGPQVGGNWASYTNADLNIDGNGRAGWCQETTTDSSAHRVYRGVDGVAGFGWYTASYAYSSYGWRPCLELIPNT